VTIFNGCLQDDTDPTTVLVFNTQTGDYRFCCHGSVFVGKGTVTQQGNSYSLTQNVADRRVNASLDGSLMRGTASLQTPPGVSQCTITDRKISNNSCQCP
jgi:hypothetical protein